MKEIEPIAFAVPPDKQRGVLVVDPDGKVRTATGLAEQPGLIEAVLTAWREAKRLERRVFPIQEASVTDSLVAVTLPAVDATVIVVMPRDARDPLFEFVSAVNFSGDILSHFLTNPFEALSVVDQHGIIRYLSPVHERFFGLQPGGAVGRHTTEVVENSRLHLVAESGKAEIGLLHEMRGVTRVVNRHPIRNTRGETVGAIGQIMFKGPEKLQALSNELNKLKSVVVYYRRELDDLRNRSYGLEHIVGESSAMLRLKQQIIKVAPLDVPVLLTGESGTGKELAAHAIHKLSSRRDGTLVMVNAAALPSTLVESELFGYESGAFTGAEKKGRKGKIEHADSGTLFFDEVGDMPADVQVKLLRVLQDGTFQRVGGMELRRSNFRLVSASNRNFEEMIADGTFRLDLFYRIGGVIIRLPSLRERLEDITQLADLALKQFAERHHQQPKVLSEESIKFLKGQLWPGNVRQLMHVVERAAIFSESDAIHPSDFGLIEAEFIDPPLAPIADPGDGVAPPTLPNPSEPMRVSSAVEQVEVQLIRQAMSRFNGNKKRVAAELGISRSYLYKRLAQIGFANDRDH